MATYEIKAEMNLKKIITESREVVQALNEFVDNLERIEKKYAEPQESEENKSCDTCEHSDEIDGSNCYECVKGIRDRYNLQPCDALLESEDKE